MVLLSPPPKVGGVELADSCYDFSRRFAKLHLASSRSEMPFLQSVPSLSCKTTPPVRGHILGLMCKPGQKLPPLSLHPNFIPPPLGPFHQKQIMNSHLVEIMNSHLVEKNQPRSVQSYSKPALSAHSEKAPIWVGFF